MELGHLRLQPPRTYLFIQEPQEADLVSQPFQAGLQLYLVHVSFIHILGKGVGAELSAYTQPQPRGTRWPGLTNCLPPPHLGA